MLVIWIVPSLKLATLWVLNWQASIQLCSCHSLCSCWCRSARCAQSPPLWWATLFSLCANILEFARLLDIHPSLACCNPLGLLGKTKSYRDRFTCYSLRHSLWCLVLLSHQRRLWYASWYLSLPCILEWSEGLSSWNLDRLQGGSSGCSTHRGLKS